ncbi:hypothetical protein E2562_036863 [Oryza meyeriana var. granulata]|uniref:Uncharacterized protein n=1 Tax=Oryza meyeriana var. granulata TaxID=110450 RepID=A0A6G1ECF8_9ORYZ|nr:hypothetical protein E2562_036863 [Oryza meyeriana var. granulata]
MSRARQGGMPALLGCPHRCRSCLPHWERKGGLAFFETEEVLWRTAWRVPPAVLTVSTAGEVALRVGDVPPLLGVSYGVFSASFDLAVEGSWLGYEKFVPPHLSRNLVSGMLMG